MCSGASAGGRLAAVGMAKYTVTFCSKPLFLDRLEHSYLVTDGESFWLGSDLGTQSVRAVAVSEAGHPRASTTIVAAAIRRRLVSCTTPRSEPLAVCPCEHCQETESIRNKRVGKKPSAGARCFRMMM